MADSPQKNELYSEHKPEGFTERYLGLSYTWFFVAIASVVFLGIYISVILFGDSSLEVLLELEEYENHLKQEIAHLKNDNADLQKEYFELNELAPDSK